MNANISERALSILYSSKYSSICFKFNFFNKLFSVPSQILDSSWLGHAIFSMPYFSARLEVLEIRFPSLFASSLLWRSIRASLLKSPSSPNEASRKRKYLAESRPAIPISSSILITFPRDFEIFSLSKVHQPCAKTCFGSSNPADIRNAGQYTVWNQKISLPTMWTFAGQKSSFPFSRVAE